MVAKSTALGAARAAAQIGEDMLLFVLPVLAYKATQRLQDPGLVFFTVLAANLVGCALAGLLSDRVGERRVYSISTAVRAFLVLGALAVAVLRPTTGVVPLLMVVGAIDGLLGGMSGVAFEATGPRLFGDGQAFTRLQAVVQGADQLSVLLAPVAGALALTHFGGTRSLLPIAVLYVASALLFVASTSELTRPLPSVRDQGARASAREAVRVIRSTPPLVSLLVLTMLDNLLLGLFAAGIIPLGLGLFGVGEQVLGTTISLAGTVALASVIACPFIVRWRSVRWLWLLSYLICFAGFLLLGLAPHLVVYALALALIEISCAQGIYALRIIRARVIPGEHLGKVIGLMSVFQQATLPIGGLVVGLAGTPENLRAVFMVTTAVLAVVTAFLLRRVVRATERGGMDADFTRTAAAEASASAA